MRFIVVAALLLAGCDNVAVATKKEEPDLVHILCLQHETAPTASPTSPLTESDKRYANVTQCLWKQAVDLAPAPDDATIITKVVLSQCELPIAAFSAASLKEHFANAPVAEKAEVINANRSSWEAEALTYVVTARAAKCTNPHSFTRRPKQ